MIRARAYLLVGSEADAYLAVLFSARDEPLRGGNYRGNASLVIGAEKRCAVGDDKVAADIFFKGGIILGAHDDAALVVQHDVPAAVFDRARLYHLVGRLVGGVHMRDEPYHGRSLAALRCGQGRADISVFVHHDVGKSECRQLADKIFAEPFLLFGAGAGRGMRIRHGRKRNVFEKSFCYIHFNLHLY